MRLFITSLLAMVPWAPAAQACPVCDRETGRLVRAGIFDHEFGFNRFVTASPFIVLLGSGVVLIAVGLTLVRSGRDDAVGRGQQPGVGSDGAEPTAPLRW